ncbi:MAG TPA: hypothetical protein VGG74_12280 [Kofleriaceae bacterium]|jgi:hypothetical protein
MADDKPDQTVKDLLDAATKAELARWFGLPSFEELGEAAPPPPEDPETAELRARRAAAAASVDPELLDAMHQRYEVRPSTLLKFEPKIDFKIKTEMGSFDHVMAARAYSIAEPREVEIPEELRDDMKDVAPQALLRDLHRPETTFDKQFELIDPAAAQRLDIVAEVASAMATSWKLPPLEGSAFEEQRKLLAEDAANRRRPWTEIVVRNRRVSG